MEITRREALVGAAVALSATQVANAALSSAPPAKADAATIYNEEKFSLGTLDGLSEKLVEQHLKLYAGYVKNVNLLASKLDDARAAGKLAEVETHELRRRFGFEWNGMRLHELYFSALRGG